MEENVFLYHPIFEKLRRFKQTFKVSSCAYLYFNVRCTSINMGTHLGGSGAACAPPQIFLSHSGEWKVWIPICLAPENRLIIFVYKSNFLSWKSHFLVQMGALVDQY